MRNIIKSIIIGILFTALTTSAAFRTLTVPQGGTQTGTIPSLGQILFGQSDGSYEPQATSTLGFKLTDWLIETNFSVPTLTSSTTIPVWIKDALYASSTGLFNGNLEILKATPELKLTDTGDGNSLRLVRTDTNGQMNLYNTVNKPGGAGNALNFGGTDEYVSVANESNFDFEKTQAFTIATWFQHTADEAADPVIIAKQENSGTFRGYGVYFDRSENKVSADIRTFVSERIVVLNNTAISDGVWYSVVLTYDGSGLASGVNVYVNADNSSMTTTADNLGVTILNNVAFQIAGRAGANRTLNGLIDEPAVFDRELTSGEVSDYHNSAAGLYLDPSNNFPSSGTPISTNLVGLWHLDESSGTNVSDSSGNSNTGTTQNMEDGDWVTGKVLVAGTDVEVSAVDLRDSVRSGVAGKLTIGQNGANTPEVIYDGYDHTWNIAGSQVMALSNGKTLTIDNGVTTVPQAIFRDAPSPSSNTIELQESDETITSSFSATGVKLMANAGGNVTLFEDVDVADNEASPSFILHRKAPEGDDSLDFHFDQFQNSYIESTNNIRLFSTKSGGLLHFGYGEDNDFTFGKNVTSGVNPTTQYNGWITAASTRKYVQWQVNDTTDWFEYTREDANILGMDIQMPLSLSDNNITNVGDIALDSITADDGTGPIIINDDIFMVDQEKIYFDSTDTSIGANTDNPEDLVLEADQDILLQPDNFVGIATTSPSSMLTVAGDVFIEGLGTQYLNFSTSTGATGVGIRNNNGVMEFKNIGGSWYHFEREIMVASSTVITGTEIGSYASTTEADRTFWHIEEVTGVPGFEVLAEFNHENPPTELEGYLTYNGSAVHFVEVQAYDFTNSLWVDFRDATNDVPSNGNVPEFYEWEFPEPHSDYLSTNMTSMVRFIHTTTGNAAHDLFIDKLWIEE